MKKKGNFPKANDILQVGDTLVITGMAGSQVHSQQRNLLKACNNGQDFMGVITQQHGDTYFDLKMCHNDETLCRMSLSKWVHMIYCEKLIPWCAKNNKKIAKITSYDGWLYTSVKRLDGTECNLALLTGRLHTNALRSMPNPVTDAIAHACNGEDAITTNSLVEKRIVLSDKKRDILCDYWFGNINTTNCFICQRITISRSSRQGNFVAAHIVAHMRGGSDVDLWNYVPCCNGCNAKMGTNNPRNLLDFVQEYYPSRLRAICATIWKVFQREQPIGLPTRYFEHLSEFICQSYFVDHIGNGGYLDNTVHLVLKKYEDDYSHVQDQLLDTEQSLNNNKKRKRILTEEKERLVKKRRCLQQQQQFLDAQNILICNNLQRK